MIRRMLASSLLLMALVGITACGDRKSGPTATSEPGAPTSETAAPVTPPADAQPSSSGPEATTDFTIIPGQRVGPVTSETSRQDLATIYGEAALQDEDIPMGEGTTEPGTVVNLSPERRFAIVWLDSGRNRPLLAKDFGTAWKTPEGLGVGADYTTLKAVLGRFQLYGFGWDYGGSLVLEGSQMDKYYGDLLLRVNPSEAAIGNHPEAYQAVMGDTLFSGDDPNLTPLDIAVDEMVVYLNALPAN